MPLTYHFRPFPTPGESHLIPKPQQTRSGTSPTLCPCHKELARCKRCRQQEREEKYASSCSSQTVLPSIKEEADPLRRPLTPKAIRDQRRASSRVSVSAAFDESVGSEDYFTFYHSTAFARSPSASSGPSYRERSARRLGSASRTQSLRSSMDEGCLPPTTDLMPVDSTGTAIEGQDLSRRGS